MLKKIARHFIDLDSEQSLSIKHRRKRMKTFERYFEETFLRGKPTKTIRILDIGGTYGYWKKLQFKYSNRCEFTLLNLSPVQVPDTAANMIFVQGTATDLSGYTPGDFDLVYSNSCIEHIGKFPEWKKMADEVQRISRHYFIQTPNKYFGVEPHFLLPFFQFFPSALRVWILMHFQIGNYPKAKDREQARRFSDGIHLLSARDLRKLFPDARIEKEKLGVFTKSYMIVK